MWSLEFVEVADEPCRRSRDEVQPSSKAVLKHQPMSSSLDVPDNGEKSTAERLRDFKDPEYLAAAAVEMGSSAESDGGGMEGYTRSKMAADSPGSSSTENLRPGPADLIAFDDSTDAPEDPQSPSDFEMVSENDVKDAVRSALPPSGTGRRRLREGFHWQRQLVFRSKLTMHTAFERKDNKDPAAVTALAISK